MTNTSEKETTSQEKKNLRKKYRVPIPRWLFSHQENISDGARRLLLAVLELSDYKTGDLRIPGRGWISLKSIAKKAGMCDETRKRFMRELCAQEFVRVGRPYVTRKIGNRMRTVKGAAHVMVRRDVIENVNIHSLPCMVHLSKRVRLPRKDRAKSSQQTENTSNHAASSTGGFPQKAKTGPQDSVSTTGGFPEKNAKNEKTILLSTVSSTVDETTDQYLSNSTVHGGACAGVVGSSTGNTSASGATGSREQVEREPVFDLPVESKKVAAVAVGSKSTKEPKPETAKPITTTAINPELQSKREALVQQFIGYARDDRQHYSDYVHLNEQFDSFRHDANCLAMAWKEIQSAWKRVLDEVLPSPEQIETYLTDQLSAYVENCIFDTPELLRISFHETHKLLETQLRYRGWDEYAQLCGDDMQERIYTAVETQFAEYLSTPETFYGYFIIKRPPEGNYVPDPTWMMSRANLIASWMDGTRAFG